MYPFRHIIQYYTYEPAHPIISVFVFPTLKLFPIVFEFVCEFSLVISEYLSLTVDDECSQEDSFDVSDDFENSLLVLASALKLCSTPIVALPINGIFASVDALTVVSDPIVTDEPTLNSVPCVCENEPPNVLLDSLDNDCPIVFE